MEEVLEEKRVCEYLYIEADENHIHRQKEGEEQGCFIGKLVYLFEGKEETGKVIENLFLWCATRQIDN